MRSEAEKLALGLIRRFEGLSLTPYLCPAGVATIGYGCTHYEDGTPVTLKDRPITKQRAENMLLYVVRTIYFPITIKLCPNVDTPGVLAALVDFAFNLGPGRLRSSTLRKRVNQGNWEAAKIEIMKWVYVGGKRLRGLERRRIAEIALF